HRQWPLAGVSRALAPAPRVHAVPRMAAGTGRRVRPGGRIRHRMIRRAPDVAGCVHLSSPEIPMRRLSASPFRASLLILALATAGAVPALAVDSPPATTEPATDAALQAVLAGDWRSADNRARDQYRHPAQTLAFFGLAPDQTVVEITPGGGWYAEILAPYLRGQGQYVAAIVDPAAVPEGRGRDYQQRSKDGVEKRFAEAPERFDAARIIGSDPAAPKFAEAGSADLVLTFRNVHNWRGSDQAEGMFKGFFEVLKPGGVLGVVEHRAKADVPADDRSGYVGEAQVIAMAEAAGFTLDAKS